MNFRSILFSIVISIALFACSSPKKTPAEEPAPKISRTDRLRGGTSFSNPVVIQVTTERAGLDEEYRWLSNNYPGYSLVRRKQATQNGRYYHIVSIRTKSGQARDIYFDSTAFVGKN
ncbi:MAG TPA: hypothetical protein PK951_08910 [Chitinophagaceae bacterium]|nr:hypothetical protein [Chitinophagaceae bacterium]